ncbi:MAG: ribonuclease HI family protein [Bacteroidota bacterium]
MILYAFTDGASRGNPGESGFGIVVKDDRGDTVLTLNGYIGRTTNNIAEYTALLKLLERMRSVECSRMIVHSDSELMVKQLNGFYRVRNKGLKRYHARFQELKKILPFDIHIRHIGREENKDADRLANEAIDTRISPSG